MFWSRVDKTGDCWLWTGATYTTGYGRWMVPEAGFRHSHRLVYEELVGPLGAARLTQTCGNKRCVKPEHLELERDLERDYTERFWSKVAKSDGCWLWVGRLDPNGYGRFALQGIPKLAHRVCYELVQGPISEGSVLDHKCHTPACVRPEHLRPSTQKQNTENRKGLSKANKSGVHGVSWSKAMNKWLARVMHGGVYYDSYHAELAEAAEAVKARRLELFTHNDVDRS